MDMGLREMCVGEKRTVIIPPHLGYGEAGVGEWVMVFRSVGEIHHLNVWVGSKAAVCCFDVELKGLCVLFCSVCLFVCFN